MMGMEVYGLIGNPVEHSLSPPMHEAAYAALDIDARYVTFEPAETTLDVALTGADALGIRGLNVTIPYKQAVMPFMQLDDLADQIGAVNTIDFADEITGYNTDATGVIRSFDHHDVDREGEAVVVGAGGAGRACAFALASEGMTVQIANRTYETAETLADDIQHAGWEATAHELATVGELLPNSSILVNATSVGMGTDETPVPADALHSDLTVLDAVYDPIRTRLLRDAERAGARTIDGAWMLLFQGAEAFEIWTGRSAPIEAMNTALRSYLDNS